IPQSMLIAAQRREPRTSLERAIVRALSNIAVSRWYRITSLNVEARAWWKVRNGFRGLVHFLWAERDWGFLDRFPVKARPPLCATFHSCPDTLPEVVRNTKRLRKLDAIILMSEVQRPFFERSGVPRERIHVIRHGVDCQRFRPAWDRQSQTFTILS